MRSFGNQRTLPSPVTARFGSPSISAPVNLLRDASQCKRPLDPILLASSTSTRVCLWIPLSALRRYNPSAHPVHWPAIQTTNQIAARRTRVLERAIVSRWLVYPSSSYCLLGFPNLRSFHAPCTVQWHLFYSLSSKCARTRSILCSTASTDVQYGRLRRLTQTFVLGYGVSIWTDWDLYLNYCASPHSRSAERTRDSLDVDVCGPDAIK